MTPTKYQRIADDLRNQIQSDAFPGGKLPPEGELQEIYGASRNTIRDAIKQLVSLGLVQTRPGQGTFVTGAIDPFVTTLSVPAGSGFGGGEGATYLSQVGEQHRTPSVSKPRVEIQIPAQEIALRLRIAADAQVVSRHQARYIDETPWSLQTSFYPMEFALKAPDLFKPEDITVGAMSYLETTEGIKQVGYRDWITARTADEQEQAFFGIAAHATVFELFRTAFDDNGQPLRVTVTVCPTDRNQFIVNVGKVPDPQYDLPTTETQADGADDPGDAATP